MTYSEIRIGDTVNTGEQGIGVVKGVYGPPEDRMIRVETKGWANWNMSMLVAKIIKKEEEEGFKIGDRVLVTGQKRFCYGHHCEIMHINHKRKRITVKLDGGNCQAFVYESEIEKAPKVTKETKEVIHKPREWAEDEIYLHDATDDYSNNSGEEWEKILERRRADIPLGLSKRPRDEWHHAKAIKSEQKQSVLNTFDLHNHFDNKDFAEDFLKQMGYHK